jgi:S1-C subfamily serine protease
MKKLIWIFAVALFFPGCGTINKVKVVDVSYDPIDYPRQLFTSKDKRPVIYIDPVIDNRKFAIEQEGPGPGIGLGTIRNGRFEEDPKLIRYSKNVTINRLFRTSKSVPEIVGEALEMEVRRLGIETTKNRGSAGIVLKPSIEKFVTTLVSLKDSTAIVRINLKLYQTDFDSPVWSGTLKGNSRELLSRYIKFDIGLNQLNKALKIAIKQWHGYPGFHEAMVSLSGNVTFPPPSQPAVPQPSVKQQVVSGGTGFLFSSKDYVITNYHVVEGANSIRAKFTNGQMVEAVVVAKDPKNDIAILKLANAPPLSAIPIKLGDSSQARTGEKIFTIGYPASKIMGERPKYSEGVINSMTGLKDDPAFFQVSVPVQPGNSGGPLFNGRGEVIGITTASLSLLAIDAMGAIPQNVNYAIKSSFVKNLLSTIPELMLSNTGIVVVPNEPGNSLPNFIEQASKNIVLIEAK